MLFAIAAVPGSLLIARLGVTAAMVVGLALNALGGALRGALPDVAWLYAMTIVMGVGRRHHAGDHAAGRARLGAAADRIRDRALHQWPDHWRNPAGRR